jgi:hypothetical protein
MPFGKIQELKRGYSASFEQAASVLDKCIESPSEIADNSKTIIQNLKVLTEHTADFINIVDKNPDLKVGNLINAKMNAEELYDKSSFFRFAKGIIPNIVRFVEKYEKEQKKLAKADEKEKLEIEKNSLEILKCLEAERNTFKVKVSEFIKYLESAGSLEIKNQNPEETAKQ